MEHDLELATIRRWLHLSRARPAATATDEDFSACGDCALDNAVARILLETVQSRLPSWGYVNDEGEVVETRERLPLKPRSVQLLPQLLFSINWADSGPGFSWPESYFVTYVPGLNVRIVTASSDSDDLWRHTDLAIGWCAAVRSTDWGTKRIVTQWWRRASGGESLPWADLLDGGLIGAARALAWRREVWGAAGGDRAQGRGDL